MHWLVAAFLCISISAYGQSDRAILTGGIIDPTGAVVPTVEVVATNLETNFSYKTQSNAAGFFVLPSLPSGTYEVSVEKEGFAHALTRVRLTVAERLRTDFRLELQAASESVLVTSGAEKSALVDNALVSHLH